MCDHCMILHNSGHETFYNNTCALSIIIFKKRLKKLKKLKFRIKSQGKRLDRAQDGAISAKPIRTLRHQPIIMGSSFSR